MVLLLKFLAKLEIFPKIFMKIELVKPKFFHGKTLFLLIFAICISLIGFWGFKTYLLNKYTNNIIKNYNIKIEEKSISASHFPASAINLEDISFDFDDKSTVSSDGILLKLDLLTNKLYITFEDEIKFNYLEENIYNINMSSDSEILLEFTSDNNLNLISIDSPNIKVFNDDGLLADTKDLKFNYAINYLDDEIKNNLYLTSNSKSYMADDVINISNKMQYSITYDKLDYDRDDSLPKSLDIHAFDLVSEKFSINLNGYFKPADFSFHLELANYQYLLELFTSMILGDNERLQEAMSNSNYFQSKEQFQNLVEFYRSGIFKVIDIISNKNKLTNGNKAIFDIVSDPVNIVKINDLYISDIQEIIMNIFKKSDAKSQ